MSPQNTADVLIIEDTLSMALMYEKLLKNAGISSEICQNGATALNILKTGAYKTVVLDLQLPEVSGLEILADIDAAQSETTFIVITANGSVNSAVDAMRLGAYDFLIKPFPEERLVTSIKNAIERASLKTKVSSLSKAVGTMTLPGFIGSSSSMLAVYKTIESIANSKAPVFVTGESGTGKEVTARAIHDVSDRKKKPFVAINCAAIPENLMESEIFGHVKGAFTGADAARKGAASQANGGTLFLDEICEMDIGLQAKLLRFLQTSQIKRVGSDWTEEVDVRIVCATNRNPFEEVTEKRFREDLYYRLNVLTVDLPPLRDRDQDVLELARSFLKSFSEEEGKSFRGLSEETKSLVLAHRWPGNIRELQNTIRKAVVMFNADTLEPDMLSLTSPQKAVSSDAYSLIEEVTLAPKDPNELTINLDQPLADIERIIIEAAIELRGGSIPKASDMLSISPSTVYRKKEGWDIAQPSEKIELTG